MDLTAEAIGKIENLTNRTKKTELLIVPHEPKHVYFLVGPEGHAEKQVAEPEPLKATMATPQELLKFIIDNVSDQVGLIVYDETKAVFFPDATRRASATCPLKPSEPWQILSRLESSAALDQKALVRLLQIKFRGVLQDSDNVIAAFRNLKFSSKSDGASTVNHGKSTMGKSLQAEVSGEKDLPKELVFKVQVYENFAHAVDVICFVDIDAENATFKLTPYPLELRNAQAETVQKIGTLFAGKDRPKSYYGSV